MAYAADTHLHADSLTGVVQLARVAGAQVMAPASGNREYPHTGLADGDEVDLGGLRLRAMATPGPTHEWWFLLFRTAGCATNVHDRHIERATNTLLRAGSEDAFVEGLLDSLGTFPPYFLRVGEIKRRGPAAVEGDTLAALTAVEVVRLITAGAQAVDVRPLAHFGAGHVPGSVSIPPRVFATWLGWLIDTDKPIVVVRNPDQDPAEIIWQAREIGYDQLAGELDGGLGAWTAADQPTGSIPVAGPEALDGARVLDIRQSGECQAGHVPAADDTELGALTAADLPDEPLVVVCGHGERAMGAASLLARAGHHDVTVLDDGPQHWADPTATGLETGQ